jgi:uncharacterized protein with NAD-binding domain and iron-sulfur cluster
VIEGADWPADQQPGSIAYFCAPMPDPDEPEPPLFSDLAYPASQLVKVEEFARRFAENDLRHLWPQVCAAGGLDCDVLIDFAGGTGADRLSAQFWKANIDPSDRYVLSPPGSTGYRLRGDRSGYANLYLAGDWTRNGVNAGCVEAAALSGLQAARAIRGDTSPILGEQDLIRP